MRPGEFVYKQCKAEALKQGADPKIAELEAQACFQAYKENRFKKPLDLIENHIKAAVKLTKDREKSLL